MLRSLRVQLKKRCNRVNASLLDAVFYDIDDDAKESSGYLLCYTKISLDIHNNANAFGRFALGMTSAYVRTRIYAGLVWRVIESAWNDWPSTYGK
jgi:hypothetical protein